MPVVVYDRVGPVPTDGHKRLSGSALHLYFVRDSIGGRCGTAQERSFKKFECVPYLTVARIVSVSISVFMRCEV